MTSCPVDPLADRYIRQADIIPADALRRHRPLVVGTGAIGSLVARQLAHMGCPRVGLCDPDTVAVENLCCQGFGEADLGRPKVQALAAQLTAIHSRIELTLHTERFRRSVSAGYDVFFVCVDRIATRAMIWSAVGHQAQALFDARVKGGDTIRVLAVRDEPGRRHYPRTLFGPDQAQQGPCTAKMTIYGAFVAAGLLVHQYAQWLRGFPATERDWLVNLAAGEMEALAMDA